MLPIHISDAIPAEHLSMLTARLATPHQGSVDDPVGPLLCSTLLDSPVFQMSLHPRRLSRVEVFHVHGHLNLDLPVRAVIREVDGSLFRADVGILACLTGACSVELDAGYRTLSLPLVPGECILCPSSVPLAVSCRDEAVIVRLWAESLVRSEAIREALHDLATASAFAELMGRDESEGAQSLRACYHKVLAMYAET